MRVAARWIFVFLLLLYVVACKRGPWLPTDPNTATEKLWGTFKHEIERRGIKKNYQEFLTSLKQHIEIGNEDRTGKCRLRWVNQLVESSSLGIQTAENFSRNLYESVQHHDFPHVFDLISDSLDVSVPHPAISQQATNTQPVEEPLAKVIRTLHETTQSMVQAFAALNPDEKSELRQKLYYQTTGGIQKGFTFANQEDGKRVADLLEKIDRHGLISAARALIELSDQTFLEKLADSIRAESTGNIEGVEGRIVRRIDTPDGSILIGGADSNTYHLDELPDVAVIIDLGGNDHYIEGSLSEKRPVFIILDLSGDDIYTGKTPGIQGGAIMGASLLIDERGNDSYESSDVAQGSSLAGVGILIDQSGNDTYLGDRRVQGQAIGGIGILIDEKGDDHYRAALLSQAVGGPLGFGSLIDLEGTDTYFAGGKYPDPYDDTPGFSAFSQGVGTGAESIANGGIGVLLDGSGNDLYQGDYFGYGGGYWFGVGIARDFGGDDRRIGATTENFDGSMRTEEKYLRWGIGFACHYSAGYVFDDDGNDSYQADWASIAYAWDFSVATLCDFRGNDRYVSTGSGVAEAVNRSLAILYDVSGDDIYQAKQAGFAEKQRKESTGLQESSFTLLFDSDGRDTYNKGLKNNSNIVRGWKGGIFIDQEIK